MAAIKAALNKKVDADDKIDLEKTAAFKIPAAQEKLENQSPSLSDSRQCLSRSGKIRRNPAFKGEKCSFACVKLQDPVSYR